MSQNIKDTQAGDLLTRDVLDIKGLIRKSEAYSAAVHCGLQS